MRDISNELIGRRYDNSGRVSYLGMRFIFRASILAFFAYLLNLLNNDSLPDYDSYLLLFEISSDLGGRYIGLSESFGFFKEVGLSYASFRAVVFSLGILITVFFMRFSPKVMRAPHSQIDVKRNDIFLLVLLFSLILEFYLVRLRAGISILFFCSGFLFIINRLRFGLRNIFKGSAVLISFSLSALVHVETFIVLFSFLLPPVIWLRIEKYGSYKKRTFYFLACIIMWLIIFFYAVSGSTTFRGEHLASDLNPVRFFSISVLPIIIWGAMWMRYRKIFKRYDGINAIPYLFYINYFSCAVALFLFYFSGVGNNDGEAIVRVVTLSSIGAAICISGWGIGYKNIMAIYLLVMNSLFFINTLYF